MVKLTYNKGKIELKEIVGDETMKKLDKVLSVTEKETSHIELINISPLRVLFQRIATIRMHLSKGNKKLTRVLLDSDNIVKLETSDNGTPFVFVINENHFEFPRLESKLKVFCLLQGLKFRKIEG